MKKVFSTLFTEMMNIHLIKDPGMIPFTFNNDFGYKSIIPIFKGRKYPYKDLYFSDIEMPVLPTSKHKLISNLFCTIWLIKNSKRIDLLNLYFFDRRTWLMMWIYKKMNPKGLIYIHVDTDGNRLLNYEFSKNPVKSFIAKKVLLNEAVLKDTFWGIQNSSNAEKLKGRWPFYTLGFIPNGIHWESNISFTYKEKKNIILTVARVGSPEKNNDKLMIVFKQISKDFPKWKLRFVGPIEESFKPYIHDFLIKNPEMRERIEFVGPIYDRNKLELEYVAAKIFCLPSSWESFGIAGAESLSKGCYFIGSRIPSNIQLTQNETLGSLFENENWDDLEEKLRDCLSNESKIKDNFQKAISFANEHYKWKKILEPVKNWAEEKWRIMDKKSRK